jgi:hypothetical protein
MSLKRWLPLLGALGLMVMVVGVASGASNGKRKPRILTRACFWVETKGDRVTYHDVKISKLNRTDVRFCIVGKAGAKGRTTRGIAGLAGPLVLRALRAPTERLVPLARRVKSARQVAQARRVIRATWVRRACRA